MSHHHPLVNMRTLCELFGKSRQAWYEMQKRDDILDFHNTMILSEVLRLRLDLPSVGVEVLHHQLKDFCHHHGIKIGRDKLRKLLRDNNLLVKRKASRVKTTWSHHHLYKYTNLIKKKEFHAPNTLWVSDITYLPLVRGFAYLSMITDAYSRKIVGWSLHESLQVEGPLSALKMALAASKRPLNKDLIHHSDRGVQYCSRKYTDLLRVNNIAISMTEQGDPYENALAERMNRTIKEEMLLNKHFFSFSSAEKEVRQAIENYNNLRPHGSCNYYTPQQVHTMQIEGPFKQKWRVSKSRKNQNVQIT